MKTGTMLLLGGGAYLLYQAFEKAQFANTVNILFQGVTIENLNSIIVKMVVQNITDTTVTVNSMTGTLLLNGNEIANISKFDPQTIASNSQTEIDVKVSPDLGAIVMNFTSLISTPGSQLNFTAMGNVNLSGLPILPFNLDKTVTI
jgi:LEA14-like dessication related protein